MNRLHIYNYEKIEFTILKTVRDLFYCFINFLTDFLKFIFFEYLVISDIYAIIN